MEVILLPSMRKYSNLGGNSLLPFPNGSNFAFIHEELQQHVKITSVYVGGIISSTISSAACSYRELTNIARPRDRSVKNTTHYRGITGVFFLEVRGKFLETSTKVKAASMLKQNYSHMARERVNITHPEERSVLPCTTKVLFFFHRNRWRIPW